MLLMVFSVMISSWALLNILYVHFRESFERRGFKLYYGLVLVYKRSKKIRQSSIVRKISYVSILLFILALIFFYYSMILGLMARAGLVSNVARPMLLIPGVNIVGDHLFYFILMIIIAAIIHEFAHAYTARSYNIRVKSLGFAIVLFIPLAFTEIDEEDAAKSPRKARIATLAAGPASNFILGLLFMYLFILAVSPTTLVIEQVLPGSLADKYGLKPGSILLSINGTPATRDVLRHYLEINNNTYLVLTIINPSGAMENITIYKPANTSLLGVYLWVGPNIVLVKLFGAWFSIVLTKLLYWGMIVNVGLALVNAAPLFISDGGRIAYELLGSRIGHMINFLSLLILVLAVAGP
ncbi:site-2 protease family protein [Staphylothermus marinus]|uniref:site-2 protease family protein n=1 Tax=Staphylothermus marinus TaxID=2280 RepID=UPI001FCABA65|nr:site-2 protease family protein [Staphylothermus marinus]